MNDAALIWHRQLDPAPGPSRLAESILGIFGGLLALLGLLLFFLSRKRPPKSQVPSRLPEGPVLPLPLVSGPRVEGIGWLLLAILGIALLVIVAGLAAQ